jgi:prepilin-type processing-associated H-X9-DG protein
MADGIEMVTRYGKEPANHADGANVLFADMAVQWVAKSLPDQSWVMDKYKVWEGERIGGPGYYGVIDGAQARWFPDCRAGTWRRRGYIENPRLLDPEMGSATGEDDIPNMLGGAPNDMDDIYYVDCDIATWGGDYGDACRWGFISYSYVSRCRNARTDKSARDCSLAGGSVFNWRGSYDAPWVNSSVPPEYAGMTWGHPDELR